MELRAFLRVTHFAAVEKDRTVWACGRRLEQPKKQKRQKNAGVRKKTHNII